MRALILFISLLIPSLSFASSFEWRNELLKHRQISANAYKCAEYYTAQYQIDRSDITKTKAHACIKTSAKHEAIALTIEDQLRR